MDEQLINVDVGVGFLQRLCQPFVAQYGAGSAFVLATADLLTLTLAEALDRAGQPHDEVARVADDQTVRAIKSLVDVVPQSRGPLIREAMGFCSLGNLQTAIDSELGSGLFGKWLKAFESKDFRTCQRLLESADKST